jgi:hypothetical protein
MFIGSSINIGNRLVDHLVNEDTKEHFQNAIALYGLDTFTFVVVEVYEVDPQLLNLGITICVQKSPSGVCNRLIYLSHSPYLSETSR